MASTPRAPPSKLFFACTAAAHADLNLLRRLVDTVTRPSIAGLVNSIAAAPELYTVGSSYNSVIVAQASGLCEGFVTFGAASQLHLRRAEERECSIPFPLR